MAFKRSRIVKGKRTVKRPRLSGSFKAPRRASTSNLRTGGFLGIEKKFIDYTFPDTVLPATLAGAEADPATALSISVCAQGDGESNRDGRKNIITDIGIKGHVKLPGVAAVQLPNICRVVMVLDTQSNGSQLNAEDVYLNASNIEHAFRNLQFTKRFKVLKDQTFILNAMAGSGDGTNNDTGGVIQAFNWYITGLKIPVQYTSTTAIIGNVVDNSIHILAWRSTGAAVTLAYESRVRFLG